MTTALPDWEPSVYYLEGVIDAPRARAWQMMIDYQAWNPTFAGASVTLVEGVRGTEGEVVLIEKGGSPDHEATPPFYCKTAKLIENEHIVWYLWMQAEDVLRNFIDFALTEDERGLVFSIHYYSQTRVSGEALLEERRSNHAAFADLVVAFQVYAAANA